MIKKYALFFLSFLIAPVVFASGLTASSNYNPAAVAISGGTITGLSSPLPVASGGTGSATDIITPLTTGSANDATARAAAATANTHATTDGTAYDSTARTAASAAQTTANTASTNASSALSGSANDSTARTAASNAQTTANAAVPKDIGAGDAVGNISLMSATAAVLSNATCAGSNLHFIFFSGGALTVSAAAPTGTWRNVGGQSCSAGYVCTFQRIN